MKKERINIIIVDDSRAFLGALKMVLENCPNYRIIKVYNNGKQLVESDCLQKADLIISDIEMPVMNGIEAAKRINHFYPDLPMLAITMHNELAFLKDIIGAGFRGVIHKPDVSKNLNDAIQQVLKKKLVFQEYLKLNEQKINGGF